MLTDRAATVMHSEACGIDVDGKRIAQLAKLLPRNVHFAANGELKVGPVSNDSLVAEAMRLLTGVLVVSHAALTGAKVVKTPFEVRVDHLLLAEFGECRVTRRKRFAGGSGHLIEVPFVLDAEGHHPTLVTPIGKSSTGTFDWGQVYGVAGKFADLKLAGFDDDQRIVVLDDDIRKKSDIGQAETILSDIANVIPFSRAAAIRAAVA